MEFDFGKLKGLIIEKYATITEFLKVSGFKRANLSNKLHNKVSFSPDEIYKLCELLDIPKESIGVYFFTPKVSKNDTTL